MNFETLGIAPALLRALADVGYTTPTPIQAQAIPLALSGEDILGGAQTGTGKTAAFALPLIQHLSKQTPAKGPRKPRALVLVPTRELAVQVSDSLKAYSRYMRLNVTTLYGGASMQVQMNNLQRGVDVLVACPGRLLDHLERGTAKLDAVEMLVFDEADRMLDMGFLPAIKRVLARVPAQRQTLLFSATFEARIKALALEFMRNPKQVEVSVQATVADTIVHRVHPVDASRKRDLLIDILAERHDERVLVFGKTKHGCDRLCGHLEKAGLPAMAIHGNKSQAARQNALNQFKSGKTRILVATDVAARGLDIPDLPLVINHDLPMVAEDYVHRIGRTGRNGARGEALSLVSPEEASLLRQIQRMLKADVAMESVPGYELSRPFRIDAPASSPRQAGKPGGQHAPRKNGSAPRPHAHPLAKRKSHHGDANKAGAYVARSGAPKQRAAQGARRDRRA